ncbi:MAG: cytochrome c oxidase assembly factor Coa1 family protein [Polyangiaceae bacterium]
MSTVEALPAPLAPSLKSKAKAKGKRKAKAPFWLWMLALIPTGFVGLLVCAFSALFLSIYSSDANVKSIVYLKGEPQVAAQLGSPVKADFWSYGTIRYRATGRAADFQVTLHGSRGDGVGKVWLTCPWGGSWRIDRAELVTPSGSTDLIGKPAVPR